ncbi:uncharacterized protein SRS1_15521 [Sporisorium reilianum f. sp. reilianum]|uniref:Peptidase S54 rhomboid domain-containing protein n=1 Tax=Sporisorium reilianum f. sp. reilianum TaxID=72559 RepID=A0A2N8UIB2_9BASI|nr:uncharacterized protein SRS1_15521 [Sporisorium reilianum f. sp. reilianum]
MVAGFAHAAISKGLIIVVSITTVLVALFQLKPFVHLQLVPHLYTHHQWYRLVTQHFAFTNSSELLLALLLLYNAGVKVERTFGTVKFAGFLVVTTAMYTAMQVVVLGVGSMVFAGEGSWVTQGRTPAGPWGPLFAILWQHHCIVPHLWSVQVGPLVLTDKHIQTHSLSLLLALSQPTSSLFAASLAILASALYRSDSPLLCALKQYRIPPRIYRILALLLRPWIGSTRLPQRSWRAEAPIRRTLQVREARLAEHNAAVASLNRSGGGVGALGGSRIASLLRRTATVGVPVGQGQGMAGIGQQMPSSVAGQDARTGWNDVPPPPPQDGGARGGNASQPS